MNSISVRMLIRRRGGLQRSWQNHHYSQLRPRPTFSTWSVDSTTGIISSSSSKKNKKHSKNDDDSTSTSSSLSSTSSTFTTKFQTIIGLEIHAQLDISTKLFSGAPVPKTLRQKQKPNSCVWPFDLGVPGFLPRLSQEAVQAAILTAAATKCTIPPVSRFERKHYFYADSPLGYQVTQQRWPIAREGVLVCHQQKQGNNKKKKNKNPTTTTTDGDNDDTFSVRIERIQLEQDTGKTVMMTRKGLTKSMVDFNRAGSALVEIVFYPDIRSSSDAAAAVETLRNLLRHIGTCDGKMEEGSLRCDLNVSIAPIIISENDDDDDDSSNVGDDIVKRAGNRVEVKNLNSIRQVQLAAEYEAIRQVEALVAGNPTGQETRTFDVKSGKTVVIRTKEGAKDYRFMPEPDLPPLVLSEEVFGGVDLETFLNNSLPELPEDARKRLQEEYGLSDYLANVITGDPPAIKMFDEAVQEARTQLGEEKASKSISEAVANLLCNELFGLVKEYEGAEASLDDDNDGDRENSVKYSKVNAKQLGEVVSLLEEGTISNTMAKQLLKLLYTEELNRDPRQVATERGFQLITDPDELATICREIIAENPNELERYKLGGKFATKITKFFLGKAMSASRGNAHPERLNEVLAEVLQEVAPDVDNS